MTGMGISRLTVKKILNQAERDVTAIYDRHPYDPEKPTALEAWGRRLAQILNPDSHEGPRTHATARGAAGRGAAVQ
jgi:hypothetical protein